MTQPTAAFGWDRIRVAIPRVVEAGFAVYVIVILGLVMRFESDKFFTPGNVQNILLQTSFLACAAFGMTLVIIAAELDLSQGSVMALIGVVAAEAMVRNNSIVLGLLAGVGVGIAAGLFNGLITAVLKVPSFITTLGLLIMARGLAREITAGNTVGNLPGGWKAWWSQEFLSLRMPIWVALGLGVVYHIILRYSRFGLRIYAVGGNAEAVRRAGINVTRVRVMVFVLGGFAVAVGSFTLLGRVNVGQPNAAQLTELYAVAAVVLGGTNLFGGRGSIPRTLAGVLLIGVIRNSLNLLNVSSNMQDVWLGVVFVLAMTSQFLRRYLERWANRSEDTAIEVEVEHELDEERRAIELAEQSARSADQELQGVDQAEYSAEPTSEQP